MRTPLLVATAVLLSSSIAAAQPADSPPPEPPPAPPVGYREVNPYVAFGLSLGVTAAGIGTLATIDVDDQIPLTLTGIGMIWLGPSTGHWYQGRIVTPGLVMRTACLLAITYGLGAAETRDDNAAVDVLEVAAMFAGAIGIVYDIGDAPSAARKRNARNRERALQQLTVVPQVSDGQAGFVLAGSF